MKKILFMCFLAMVLALNGGCDSVEDFGAPTLTPGPAPPEPAGGVVNIYNGALAADGSSYTFNMDVYVADAAGDLVSGLGYSSFDADSGAIVDPVIIDRTSDVTNYFSTALLIDQSGSMIEADPFDLRIDAAKIFFSALSENDNAALYAFAGSDRLIADMVTEYSPGFTQSLDEALVDTLKDLEGGGTPLFDSIYLTLDLTFTGATETYKSVIVLTDGADDNEPGGTTLDAATSLANTFGIKIHTIGLGENTDKSTLALLAAATGGTYTIATNTEQLEAILNSLNTLLSGGANYYSLTITVPGVNLQPGDTFVANIYITLDDGSIVTIPYIVTIV